MHVASLVLLAKETKWIYAANWGCSSKVAFLGPDPLMHGGCTYSNPSESPLFEISCRDIFISSSRIIAVTLWHVWSDWAFFPHYLFPSLAFSLTIFLPHYLPHSFIWVRNVSWVLLWTETLCWRPVENQVEPGFPGAVPTPLLPSSGIQAITRGHSLGGFRTLSRIPKGPWDQGGLRACREI